MSRSYREYRRSMHYEKPTPHYALAAIAGIIILAIWWLWK